MVAERDETEEREWFWYALPRGEADTLLAHDRQGFGGGGDIEKRLGLEVSLNSLSIECQKRSYLRSLRRVEHSVKFYGPRRNRTVLPRYTDNENTRGQHVFLTNSASPSPAYQCYHTLPSPSLFQYSKKRGLPGINNKEKRRGRG